MIMSNTSTLIHMRPPIIPYGKVNSASKLADRIKDGISGAVP
jgi:hypothetical protein